MVSPFSARGLELNEAATHPYDAAVEVAFARLYSPQQHLNRGAASRVA